MPFRRETLEVIEIEWDGPYPVEEVVAKRYGSNDYGVYQLYGTDDVLGPDTLLYIGEARDRHFGKRIGEHHEWMNWASSPISAYLGRLGHTEPMTKERWPDWKERIDRAERLLIFFCAPPYNSQGLKSIGGMPPAVVLNFKRKYRLPLEVSTLLWPAAIWSPKWRTYNSA